MKREEEKHFPERPCFPTATAPFLFLFAAKFFKRVVHSSFPLFLETSPLRLLIPLLCRTALTRDFHQVRGAAQASVLVSLILMAAFDMVTCSQALPWLPRPHSRYFFGPSGRLHLVLQTLSTRVPQDHS